MRQRRLRKTFSPVGASVVKDECRLGVREEWVFFRWAFAIDKMITGDFLPEDLGMRSELEFSMRFALAPGLHATLASRDRSPLGEQMLMTIMHIFLTT